MYVCMYSLIENTGVSRVLLQDAAS